MRKEKNGEQEATVGNLQDLVTDWICGGKNKCKKMTKQQGQFMDLGILKGTGSSWVQCAAR